MKKIILQIIKNKLKLIFHALIISNKTFGDIQNICLKINKKCYLGNINDQLLIPIDKIILPHILKYGNWEKYIIDIISQNIKQKSIFLDIGANIGLITRQLLIKKIKFKKIYCFEPDIKKLNLIKFNLKKFKNVEILNYGLGKRQRSRLIYRDIYNFGNSSFLKKTSFSSLSKIKNINNFFKKNMFHNNYPLIYKSDTQGMDGEIILELKEKYLSQIKILIIEVSNHKILLKNSDKLIKIIQSFKKFYINEKKINNIEVILEKIKNFEEFDLIMVK